MWARIVLALLVPCVALFSQAPSAQMSAPDVNQMCARVTQLMEAGYVAIAALKVSASAIVDTVKQSCTELQLRPATGQPTYAVFMNLRVYLDLYDAIPKPYPFPEVARDQVREVRDAAARLDAHFRALLDSKDADLRSADRDNTARFREDNSLLQAPRANTRRVVLLGDSITNLWRLNEYFPQEDFVNRGINGQLTGQLLTRMKSDVVDLRPTAVVVQGGTFDLTRDVAAGAIQNNYQLMADIAKANNIKVIFASVLPVNDYHAAENPTNQRTVSRPPAQIRALNDWLKTFCAQRGYVYLDYFSVLVDDKGFLMEDVSDDGLHPNAKGYRLMAPLLAKAVDLSTRPPIAAPKPVPVAPKPGSSSKPSKSQ
ncbi:MAG: GDSL-type esterase/lipase family protein [Acidobacteriota bacterium]